MYLTLFLGICCLSCLDLSAADIRHRFLAVDNGDHKLLLVDQFMPDQNWVITTPKRPRDLQLLDDERILLSHDQGAAIYALADGSPLHNIDGYASVTSARQADDGSIWLGIKSKQQVEMVQLDAQGKELQRVQTDAGSDLRLMRLTPDGGFLLGLAGPHALLQVDRNGNPAQRWDLPGKGYLGLVQPDGSILASTGQSVSIVRIESQGGQRVVAGGDAHRDAGLLWFSGFDRLDSGNIVVANWCGHGHAGEGPHLIEFDADNHIVWQWADHKAATQITNVLVLDE